MPSPGRLLGNRYLLKKELGVGGFGAVFEAEDQRLEKRVAVKVLSPRVAMEPEALTRFKQEALAASKIGHKGIVDVTDFDSDIDGTHFLVMEYLDGCDLARLIAREGPILPARTLLIGLQIARALEKAHARDIIHRDLKPANIFLTTLGEVEDFVKVIDFGISKVIQSLGGTAGLTGSGQIIGTPYYMAPEQAQAGDSIDQRADVYSLGVILYEMLVKRPPFQGTTPLQVITAHITQAPKPPSQVMPALRLPPVLDALVLRALAKSPGERFASMSAFADAMTTALEQVDAEAAAAVKKRRLRTDPGRRPESLRATGSEAMAETMAPTATPVTAPVSVSNLQASTLGRASGELHSAAFRASTSPRRSRTVWLGAAVAVVGAAIAAVLVLGARNGQHPRLAATPALPAQTLREVSGTPATAPGPAPVPASAPTRAPAPVATPAVDTVTLRFDVTPADAKIEVAGQSVAGGMLTVPRDARTLAVVVRAPGHATARTKVQPDRDRTVKVVLKRKPAAGTDVPMEDEL
jgi:serine/threonine protein kinase